MAHSDASSEAVAAPVSHTVDSAAAALSNVFQSAEPEEEPRENVEEDPNVNDEIVEEEFDEGDEPEADETDDEQEDEQDEPETAIEAPVSLKADEKAEFASLPKEAQDFVTRLEQRRNQDVQSVTTKAAEAQRQAEAKAANANKEAEVRFGQQLKAVADAFAPQQPNPANFQTIEQLQRAQTQFEYDKAQHDQFMQQVAQIGVETDEMKAERIKARDAELMKIPEIANEETRDGFIKSAFAVAAELGYDQADLAEYMDASDLKALGMAAKWKADSEKLAKLEAKGLERKRDPKTGKFRSLKPGAAQPRQSSGNRAYSEAKQRLAKSGSVDDAAAAFKAILS